MKALVDAPHQELLVIADVTGDRVLSRRLREMGFHSGCEVRVLGRAPFAGAYLIQLHDSVLALRRTEAECLWIR